MTNDAMARLLTTAVGDCDRARRSVGLFPSFKKSVSLAEKYSRYRNFSGGSAKQGSALYGVFSLPR